MVQRNLHIFGFLLSILMLCAPMTYAQAKDFVVVIDAGHGGHDSGAPGQITQEKNITLKIALTVGNLIETNCNDVKVIYTRKSDVYIPLHRRTEIANAAKADLFISIHTNSVPKGAKSPMGFEVYSQGLTRSKENLSVAKQENNVVLLEKDYRTHYQGFDPNLPESDIIFEFMQDKYMKESVHFASLIQGQLRALQRRDRGVHQDDFCVLRTSAMPSVLIETGFISSPEEEQYLNSDEGVSTISQGIFRSFMMFKREREIKMQGRSNTVIPALQSVPDDVRANSDNQQENEPENDQSAVEAPKSDVMPRRMQRVSKEEESSAVDSVFFKVQILAATTPLNSNDARLRNLSDVESIQEGGFYKYFCGSSTNYYTTFRRKKELGNRFADAFIVAYRNGQKVDVVQALREFRRHRNSH